MRGRTRPYRPADLGDLYRICLLTADDGRDATALYRDPRLPGHIFAAPYGLFEPSLAFVAEDGAGVGGYVVGARDTLAFAELLDRAWWPYLRRLYPEPPPALPAPRWTPDQRLAHVIHHRWRTPDDLVRSYPSHLHINLLPRLQARGYGSQLIQALLASLREQGSPGVHLHVSLGNPRAAGFYRHLGFTELDATGVHIFGMDLRRRP